MPYLLARAIIDGRVFIDAFTDSAVRDPNVLKLAERIQMRLDNNLSSRDLGSRPCRVTLRLKNGQTYSREVQHSKGGPEVPMTADELKAKFTDCARQTLNESATKRVLDDLDRLETLKDIRPLCQLLMG
jgi:2-methylcitrate dehydratase PrpD